MKDMKYTIIFLLIVLVNSCKDNPNEPESTKYDISVLGKIGQTRTYYSTSALYYPGTQKPFIVPPSDLKSKIQYPDSLIEKGIFIYETETEINTLNGDTLIIDFSSEGYNLYSEILNESLNYPSDGWFGSAYKWKYLLIGNKIFTVFSTGDRRLKYDLPLSVGKTFVTEYEVETVSIIGEQTVTTPAGVFDAFKIQVIRKPNMMMPLSHEYELIYFAPGIGIIKYESLYLSSTGTPLEPQNQQIVERYYYRELTSLK